MNTKTAYQDGTYLSNNPAWHEPDSPWKARQISRMLRRNNIALATMCEIGCGAGEILNRLVEEYPAVQFSGYEISPQAYEMCRKRERSNLHFFLRDLLEEKGSTFDVAAAIDVFEHVEDYFGFLRKFRTKGKYKIFHIPLDLSVQSVLRNSPILHSRQSVGHIHYFTKDTALATLTDLKYEIVDFFYTNGSLELPNRGWKANLFRLPRKFLFLIHNDIAVRLLGGSSLMVLAK